MAVTLIWIPLGKDQKPRRIHRERIGKLQASILAFGVALASQESHAEADGAENGYQQFINIFSQRVFRMLFTGDGETVTGRILPSTHRGMPYRTGCRVQGNSLRSTRSSN